MRPTGLFSALPPGKRSANGYCSARLRALDVTAAPLAALRNPRRDNCLSILAPPLTPAPCDSPRPALGSSTTFYSSRMSRKKSSDSVEILPQGAALTGLAVNKKTAEQWRVYGNFFGSVNKRLASAVVTARFMLRAQQSLLIIRGCKYWPTSNPDLLKILS